MGSAFTPERRGRLLALLETGRTVEEASATVGVNPSTVARWAAKGRANPESDAGEFAKALAAARDRSGGRLSRDDVVRLLEVAAANGSVTAQRELLRRMDAADAGEPKPARPSDPFDEFGGAA